MRLLNVRTLKLESFFGKQPPPYAILSHTWEQEELLYADIQDPAAPFPVLKIGAYKVKKSCTQALQHGFDYIWIDTCCIDKTSSAELSESINSMFAWYRHADICFAYLGDIDVPYATVKVPVERSRWLTRGWTLQELIAPRQVIFYNNRWKEIGRREPDAAIFDNSQFLSVLAKATGIPSSVLCRRGAGPCALRNLFEQATEEQHDMRLYNGICQVCSGRDTFPAFLKERYSNAQKMSWAARRVTTRRDDQAYCLLGIFEVNMPLLYGEGDVAFIRLQEEIMRKSDDSSLLAFDHFKLESPWKTGELGLLAPSARFFEDSAILPRSSRMQTMNRITVDSKLIGLRLLMCPDDGSYSSRFWLGILPCRYEHDLAARPALVLESVSHDDAILSRVLVKEVIVRPVTTELHIEERSIHGGGVVATFNLLQAQLQDIRLVRKKPLKAVSMIPPLRESPAVRIFLNGGITCLRVYPDHLGHEIIQMAQQRRGAVLLETVHRANGGTVIYIPARERTQQSMGGWDDTEDHTSGVLCLRAEGEADPFYVLFYGSRRLFPVMGDPFQGVSGRAVVQVDLKPDNGDPTSCEAMETALVTEARMNKGVEYSSKHGKRVIFERIQFLGQTLLELIVEAGVRDSTELVDED